MKPLLENRVAVITAAASGMGRASSLLFAAEGATVVAVDRDEAAGASLVAEITAAGGRAQFLACDLLDLPSVERLAAEITRTYEQVDVLFNHAGMPGPRGFEFTPEEWHRVVDLNVTAPIFLTKHLMPALRASKGASVIFTSSISGVVASVNSPVYSTVKAAVIGFMRSLAAGGGADGIRSNAIAPGATETPMLNKFFGADGADSAVIQERVKNFEQNIPLGRLAQADEVATVALFLASQMSAYITGAIVPVDGGYSII